MKLSANVEGREILKKEGDHPGLADGRFNSQENETRFSFSC